MDKIKNILKKNLKLSTAVLASIILCGGSVYATILLSSGEVSYTNNGQSNVEGALDELYTLANTAANKECQDGYYKSIIKENGEYVCKPMPSFATSSWNDIIEAYNAGVTTQLQADMEAGVTRDITLGGDLGTHQVRIANLTPCDEANTVSQSACGLVIEFADVISGHQMNPDTTDGTANGDGNKGGWQYSDMRAYVNSTTYTAGNIDYSSTGIYSNMPSDLKPLIISTSVVSGHGSNDSANFTTDDYMYLLSTREVWNYQGQYDTASETDSVTNKAYTRQIDYYNTKGVTTSSYSAAIKQRNGSNDYWWLRSTHSSIHIYFDSVGADGNKYIRNSDYTYGVSPAFRLATGVDLDNVNFATSSWNDIIRAYNAGITTQLQADMEAGVTRNITLGGDLGTHPVRIANLTKCSAVSTTSKTACGLVIEFADIISEHRMNPDLSGTTIGTGTIGGWEYSDLRAFVNSGVYANENIDYSSSGVYDKIPSELRSLIIDTTVVSGHGSNDSANFTTTDKLYLLSTIEVWNGNNDYDSASGEGITRQLDYYNAKGVTDSSYSGAIKQNNGRNSYWWLWWLRSAGSNDVYSFYVVSASGSEYGSISENAIGVSPAFRLAE